MRTLCLILSLIVFYFSTVSCCLTEDNCNEEIKTDYANNHSKNPENNDCNTCSPFLNCGTCAGFVFIREFFDFKEVTFVKNKSVPIYNAQYTSYFFAKIWQPPKIT